VASDTIGHLQSGPVDRRCVTQHRPFVQYFLNVWFWIVGLLFIVAAGVKAAQFSHFLMAFNEYRMIPGEFSSLAVYVLLILEAVGGAALFVVRTRRLGVALCCGLLILYASVIAISLLNGLNFDCGCSLPMLPESKITWGLVARNVAMICGLATLWCCSEGQLAWPRLKEQGRSQIWVAAVVLAMGITILKLKQSNNILIGQLTSPADLELGEKVASFDGQQVGGASEVISFGEADKTTLLIFSARCPHCEAVIPVWNRRTVSARIGERFIGIAINSRDEVETFVKVHELSFPVYLPTDQRGFVRNFKVLAVPRAIEVGRDARIRHIFEGESQTALEPVHRVLLP